jgi:hypothetical protein
MEEEDGKETKQRRNGDRKGEDSEIGGGGEGGEEMVMWRGVT